LLLGSLVRLNQALMQSDTVPVDWSACAYPCEVELGLDANVVAFFLILCAQDL
jgi:hypothetical protein